MKKIIALFSVLAFSASTLFNAFVVADYFVQYDYYSQVLCVNKDKPNAKCNGTCHLKIDLAKEKNPNTPLPELREFKVNCTISSVEFAVQAAISAEIRNNFKPLQTVLSQEFIQKILHPPQVLVLS